MSKKIAFGNYRGAISVALMCCTIFIPLQMKGAVILRPIDLLIAAGAAVTAWRIKGFQRHLEVVARLSLLFLLAYGWRAVDGAVRDNMVAGFKEAIQAAEYLLCGFLVSVYTASSARRQAFLRALLGGLSLIALGAFLVTMSNASSFGLKVLDEPKYTYGLATLLIVTGILYGAFKHSLVTWALSLGLITLLVLSGERSAWLGLIVALPVALIIGRRRGGFPILRGALLAAGVVGAMLLAAVAVSSRNEYIERQIDRSLEPFRLVDFKQGRINYLEADSPSNRSRLFQLDSTILLLREHPWTGIGTGNYENWAYWQGAAVFSQVDGVHGQTLSLAAENGLPPALMYLGCWLMLFLELRRQVVRNRLQQSDPTIPLTLALAIYCFVVVNFIGTSAVGVLLLFVPLGLASGMIVEQEAAAHGGAGQQASWPTVPRRGPPLRRG